MRTFMILPTLGILAATLLTAPQAIAASGTCSVVPTAEGYAALRAEPNAGSMTKARIRPGEAIVLRWQGHEPVMSGSWYNVSHFPGSRFPRSSEPSHRKVSHGWLHYSQMDRC